MPVCRDRPVETEHESVLLLQLLESCLLFWRGRKQQVLKRCVKFPYPVMLFQSKDVTPIGIPDPRKELWQKLINSGNATSFREGGVKPVNAVLASLAGTVSGKLLQKLTEPLEPVA